MQKLYAPTRKIVLVSSFEDSVIDKSHKTAFCAMRACSALLKEKKIKMMGETACRQQLDIWSYHKNFKNSDYVRAFIIFSKLVKDSSDYVPLLMTIDFGESIVRKYIQDLNSPECIGFFSRKLEEVKTRYKIIRHLAKNYFNYEEETFDSSEWLKQSEPFMATLNQLKQLCSIHITDAQMNGIRNAFSIYFLSTNINRTAEKAVEYGNLLVKSGLVEQEDVGELKVGASKVIQPLIARERILCCQDFKSSTSESSELLRVLKIIAKIENISPDRIWLLSESFIDYKKTLLNEGFVNRFFVTSETTSAFDNDVMNAGMISIKRDNLAALLCFFAKLRDHNPLNGGF